MRYKLIIESHYNRDEIIYNSLEELIRDQLPEARFKDVHEDFHRAKSDEEKIDLIETVLNAMDIPFSQEDNSPCHFKIEPIS